MTKTLLIAAAAAATLAGASMPASAQNNNKHFFNHGPRIQLFVGSGYDYGCSYYYERWEDTGSFFWKRKYYICKGWW